LLAGFLRVGRADDVSDATSARYPVVILLSLNVDRIAVRKDILFEGVLVAKLMVPPNVGGIRPRQDI